MSYLWRIRDGNQRWFSSELVAASLAAAKMDCEKALPTIFFPQVAYVMDCNAPKGWWFVQGSWRIYTLRQHGSSLMAGMKRKLRGKQFWPKNQLLGATRSLVLPLQINDTLRFR